MNVTLLHGADAAEAPEDPVLGQIEGALQSIGHQVARVAVAGDIVPIIDELRTADPGLVFNLAESFDGKSALESNVAALLNLLGLRYTGSSRTVTGFRALALGRNDHREQRAADLRVRVRDVATPVARPRRLAPADLPMTE
jgi:hypothetical protein